MRCPDTAVFRVPPFASSRRPLTHALAHLQWQEPPRFIDVSATSRASIKEPSPSRGPTTRPLRATGKSAPSVTLPPTLPHVIVWCGVRRHTCCLLSVVHRSLGDRRSMRATQARAAPGVNVDQSAPNAAASKLSHEARRSSAAKNVFFRFPRHPTTDRSLRFPTTHTSTRRDMRRAWPAALNARDTDARRPSSTSVCSSIHDTRHNQAAAPSSHIPTHNATTELV